MGAMENTYSDEKLQKIKAKFSDELTFDIYLKLADLGLRDTDIKRMYNHNSKDFQFFKNNHLEKLKGVTR